MERFAWWLLFRVVRWWSARHMDQWEKFQFETKHGPVYVTIERETPWPRSFDRVDAHGRPIRPFAK